MRRLFSTFARGGPGLGLLLMRVVSGMALVARAISGILGESAFDVATDAPAIVTGALLIAGLWTPIAGTLAAAIEIWLAVAHVEDPLAHLLLATIGGALALLGPGAWSTDARLFGWKRIDVRDRPK